MQRWLAPIAVLCAVVMTGVTVYVQLFRPPRGTDEMRPRRIEIWDELAAGPLSIGPIKADLVLVEFADFQCPFCRQYEAEVLQPLLTRQSDRVRIVFRHMPISSHANAMRAAMIAECANNQADFRSAKDVLYQIVDTLAVVSDSSIAKLIKLTDTAVFVACMQAGTGLHSIDADMELAKRIEIRGTPTVIVNGILYPRPPTLADLEDLL